MVSRGTISICCRLAHILFLRFVVFKNSIYDGTYYTYKKKKIRLFTVLLLYAAQGSSISVFHVFFLLFFPKIRQCVPPLSRQWIESRSATNQKYYVVQIRPEWLIDDPKVITENFFFHKARWGRSEHSTSSTSIHPSILCPSIACRKTKNSRYTSWWKSFRALSLSSTPDVHTHFLMCVEAAQQQ